MPKAGPLPHLVVSEHRDGVDLQIRKVQVLVEGVQSPDEAGQGLLLFGIHLAGNVGMLL